MRPPISGKVGQPQQRFEFPARNGDTLLVTKMRRLGFARRVTSLPILTGIDFAAGTCLRAAWCILHLWNKVLASFFV
jgi:hypothetical protein